MGLIVAENGSPCPINVTKLLSVSKYACTGNKFCTAELDGLVIELPNYCESTGVTYNVVVLAMVIADT